MTRTTCRVFILATFLLCIGTVLLAQRDMGTILGLVKDQTGAVIPGATVTITEDSTHVSVSVLTDDSGNYIRPLLKPGLYTVEVEMSGFKKAVQKGVKLNAGERVPVDVSLEVGQVSESIEVTGATPALQSESAELGANLQMVQVTQLPLGGQRKFSFLARVAPAVLPPEPGARDAAGGGFSANGVRSNGQNNFLLNGVDNNVNVIDFINQTAYVIGPSIEAIGEMKILTNGYNAEYGRGAGGVINVTLKSGTNGFHGSLFEFLQNDKLDANQWESNKAGKNRGPFKQNQFGGAIGGPIIKDRTFFFFDYQGTRIRSTGGAVPGIGNTLVRTIPNTAFKNGDFSSLLTNQVLGTDALGRPVLQGSIYDILTTRTVTTSDGKTALVRDPFPGNIIPSNRWDPIAKKLIDLYPNPNQNLGLRIPNNNFLIVTAGTADVNQWDVRIDHKLSEKDSLFGSLSWSNEDKFQQPPFPGPLDAAGFAGETEGNKGRNVMLSWTRVFSPKLFTETRLAYSRLVTQRTQANADKDLQKQFGIGGIQTFGPLNGGLPQIEPDGYSAVGGPEWLPTLEYSNVYDFIENVSVIKQAHSIKFGFEYRPIGFPFFQVPSPRGTVRFQRNRTQHPQFPSDTGDGIAGWLLGYPGNSRITSGNFISSEKKAYAWYIQDDWKLSPKLTLNIGLRYELFSPIGERFGRQSNFDQDRLVLVIPKGNDQDAPLPPNFATAFPQIKVERGVASKYLIPWDKKDFSPRLGIAWKMQEKTVVRAGYGIFYGGEENQGGNPNRGESLPFNSEQRLEYADQFSLVPNLGRFSEGFPVNVFTLPAAITFRTVVPNFLNPLVHKWNFAIQRELGFRTSWEVAYVGSRGQHLVNLNDPNQPRNDPNPSAPVNPRRRLPFIGGTVVTNSNGFSNYHALLTRVEKTYSNGLQFLASYTWSHALTNVGTTLAGGPGTRDVTNWSNEYSHANFHLKHRFSYSTVMDLPLGKGRKFGSNLTGVPEALIGNWRANAIVTLQSGHAFNLGTRNANCGCGGTVRPDLVSGKDPNSPPPGGRTPDLWFDITAVTAPAPGTYGNLGNYSNYGPPFRNVDFSLFKDFPVSERYRIQFRSEFFNLFNTPQFNVGTISATQGASDFGRINGTLPATERHIQFALRFEF
ncbi:MAG TPA: carboxypeptidase regulatory-like domain-containing protein [Acidobacteriota bacterium]|nr:carboxypeptidase regulatory-like domain-containing protein [Acidobacteriota bacterium]